jgi:hypothetical protein
MCKLCGFCSGDFEDTIQPVLLDQIPCYCFCMPVTPLVIFEKPGLPTLWLDTSVVIKLAKIKNGESLQDIEVRRCQRLRELVFNLVRAGRLLCPDSDQEEEYVGQRLDDYVHSMFASLSLGISLQHRQGIFDRHIFKGMEAFSKKSETIRLPASSYFFTDPVRELERVRQERFIVTVGLGKGSEMLERRARSKAKVAADWERLRKELVAQGQTYEGQLEVEKRGYLNGMAENLRRFTSDIFSGRTDFWNYMAAQGPLLYHTYWRELRGEPQGWEGVRDYFLSNYFAELPEPYIGCRLVADLVTGNEPISSGDAMDVELLEVALPLSNFVITDRRMELRIKKLGLDRRCSTDVYSMSTIDGLLDRLNHLADSRHAEQMT